MIKVANTSFQEETIKKMTLKEFKDTYKGVLKGQDLGEVYKTITGGKTPEEKPTEEVEESSASQDFTE